MGQSPAQKSGDNRKHSGQGRLYSEHFAKSTFFTLGFGRLLSDISACLGETGDTLTFSSKGPFTIQVSAITREETAATTECSF